MAAFQTGDIAAFQTIEVSSDENGAFVLAAEEDDRRGEAKMAPVLRDARREWFGASEMGGVCGGAVLMLFSGCSDGVLLFKG